MVFDHHQWRDGRGRRVRAPKSDVATIVRITRVYIACAHLNHDPTDNAPRNLAALCQRCHMIHDAAEHRRRRWLNAYRRRALGDLFAWFEPRAILVRNGGGRSISLGDGLRGSHANSRME